MCVLLAQKCFFQLSLAWTLACCMCIAAAEVFFSVITGLDPCMLHVCIAGTEVFFSVITGLDPCMLHVCIAGTELFICQDVAHATPTSAQVVLVHSIYILTDLISGQLVHVVIFGTVTPVGGIHTAGFLFESTRHALISRIRTDHASPAPDS